MNSPLPTSSTKTTSTAPTPPTSETTKPKVEGECPPPPHDPDESSLAAALKAKRGDLKPTEVSDSVCV